jgi:hypothetical protein
MDLPEVHTTQQVVEELAAAQASATEVNMGLHWFQLKPDGLTGKLLLDHIFAQIHISYKTEEKSLHTPETVLGMGRK